MRIKSSLVSISKIESSPETKSFKKWEYSSTQEIKILLIGQKDVTCM